MYDLNDIRKLSDEIRILMEQREELYEKIRSPSSAAIDQTITGNRDNGSRIERLYSKLDEVQSHLIELVGKKIFLQHEIRCKLECLSDETHKEILFDRFWLCKKIETIAKERNVNIRWVYRQQQAALNEWNSLLEKDGTEKEYD